MPKWQDFDQRISRYEMPCCCSATGNRCRTASCERMRVCEFKCQNPSFVKLDSRSRWWNPNSLTIVIELHPSFSHWNLIFLSGISISWGKSPIVLNWTTPHFSGRNPRHIAWQKPMFLDSRLQFTHNILYTPFSLWNLIRVEWNPHFRCVKSA